MSEVSLLEAPPSHRWVARIIDLCLFTPLAFVIYVPSLLIFNSIFGDLILVANRVELVTYFVSSAVFLLVLLAIDSFIGAAFGNTPGKSLMRICVVEKDGKMPTLKRRFKRSLGVGIIGLGFSIPIINSLLMIIQFFIVRKQKQTTYDKLMGFSVVKMAPLNAKRVILCFLLLVFSASLQPISTKIANVIVNPYGWYIGLDAITEERLSHYK